MLQFFVGDVEADGRAAGLHSLVSFAVVHVKNLEIVDHFRADLAPISSEWIPECLAVSNVTREQHLAYEDPAIVIPRFAAWVEERVGSDRAVFESDNPSFDFGVWLNYYLWRFAGRNPFGHSARRIGDFAAGLEGDFRSSSKWRKLRQTKHTHDPLDDAMGNAEPLIALIKRSPKTRL